MRDRTWRRRPRRTTPPKASRTGSGSAIPSPSGKDSRRGEDALSRTRSRDGRISSTCAQASRAPCRTGRPAPPQASDVSTFLSCEGLFICCLAYHTPKTKKMQASLAFLSKKSRLRGSHAITHFWELHPRLSLCWSWVLLYNISVIDVFLIYEEISSTTLALGINTNHCFLYVVFLAAPWTIDFHCLSRQL